MSTTRVVVGRVGRAHGLAGEVSVEVRTDEPERRFVSGAVLATQASRSAAPRSAAAPSPATGTPAGLTVRSARWHQSRLLVCFAELRDRAAAEAVRGLVLLADVDAAEGPEDPEEYYDHQLVGLRVVTPDGVGLGVVGSVVHGPAQDLLAIHTTDEREVLVPFVAALVPTVDLAGGRVVVADRPGLVMPAAGS